jgi:hypothetical protein
MKICSENTRIWQKHSEKLDAFIHSSIHQHSDIYKKPELYTENILNPLKPKLV